MSHDKATRRVKVIGANIKRGMTPGGFTAHFADGNHAGAKSREVSREKVHAAAVAALARRGIGGLSSAFEAEQRLPAKLSAVVKP